MNTFWFLSAGFSGDEFHFDSFGDGPARYNIIHFRRIGDNYRWVRVGSYNEGNLTLNMSRKLNKILLIFSLWVRALKYFLLGVTYS